jgi:hypothetical protein
MARSRAPSNVKQRKPFSLSLLSHAIRQASSANGDAIRIPAQRLGARRFVNPRSSTEAFVCDRTRAYIRRFAFRLSAAQTATLAGSRTVTSCRAVLPRAIAILYCVVYTVITMVPTTVGQSQRTQIGCKKWKFTAEKALTVAM